MKRRNGFVSNSSSASFVIQFKSDLSAARIEEMVRCCNLWTDEHWEKDTDYEVKLGSEAIKMTTQAQSSRLQSLGRVHCLTASTPMLNDWKDIDVWPLVRMLSEVSPELTGLKLVKILQTEEENDDVHKHVKFSRDLCVVKEEDTERKYAETEKEYLEYLQGIGIHLTAEQTVQLAEFQLLG